MRFLIHSNHATIPTGYGVQVRHLATWLAAQGHDVAISATYGQQGPITDWTTPLGDKVRTYPAGYLTNGPDVVAAHADHWFDGDPSSGWIIMCLDVWAFAKHPHMKDFQVISWCPVDHMPAPPEVLEFFSNSGAIPVAMSKFGERMLTHGGLDSHYIPLTVDTEVYQPTFTIDVNGQEVSARQLFNVPHDAFVVGMVAMNKDPGDRKNFNGAFRAFGRFWQDHQDAVLLVHSDPRGMAGPALNLHELAAHAAVPEHAIVFTDEYAYRIGLPANMMAALYTAFDVLLCPSLG